MNVIVICLDTLRADLIGPGRKMSYVETPNLDALAHDAVSFERAFGEGQPTLQMRLRSTPVGAPSRGATTMTGAATGTTRPAGTRFPQSRTHWPRSW